MSIELEKNLRTERSKIEAEIAGVSELNEIYQTDQLQNDMLSQFGIFDVSDEEYERVAKRIERSPHLRFLPAD